MNCKPVYVLRESLQYLTEQRLVIPGYTVLQGIVGAALAAVSALTTLDAA